MFSRSVYGVALGQIFFSFLRLKNFPLCIHTTFCLCTRPPVDIPGYFPPLAAVSNAAVTELHKCLLKSPLSLLLFAPTFVMKISSRASSVMSPRAAITWPQQWQARGPAGFLVFHFTRPPTTTLLGDSWEAHFRQNVSSTTF